MFTKRIGYSVSWLPVVIPATLVISILWNVAGYTIFGEMYYAEYAMSALCPSVGLPIAWFLALMKQGPSPTLASRYLEWRVLVTWMVVFLVIIDVVMLIGIAIAD